MKRVDPAELLNPISLPMTRKEKLLHWAKLIKTEIRALFIFHDLAYWPREHLKNPMLHNHWGTSAFTLALQDPVFLKEGHTDSSIAGAMRFFELTLRDLHAFSCNCGGDISNEEMARRIERIANQDAMPPF